MHNAYNFIFHLLTIQISINSRVFLQCKETGSATCTDYSINEMLSRVTQCYKFLTINDTVIAE